MGPPIGMEYLLMASPRSVLFRRQDDGLGFRSGSFCGWTGSCRDKYGILIPHFPLPVPADAFRLLFSCADTIACADRRRMAPPFW